jgi:prepilin-type N-terminal cleavage/methylation domain-containing protein/prepilin-type processing-associated H-X9-DG protein
MITVSAHRPRFTLIELLVVVTVIAILASLLLPALTQARAKAKVTKCLSQQRQLHAGFMLYADDFQEWGPGPVHWGSGQMIGLTSTKAWIDGYFPETRLFACPDTAQKAMSNASYRPGRRIATRQYMSYLMAFGTSNHADKGDLYGWHNYWSSRKTNQYRTPCPRLPMAGQLNREPPSEHQPTPNEYYVGEPDDAGMFLDLYNLSGTWDGYGLSGIPNNHQGLPGVNVTFLDGHGTWRPMTSNLRRYRAYNPDYWW